MENLINWLLVPAIHATIVTVVVLLGVAYTTYMERKIIAFMQVRIGPNRVGWRGLLQPIADTLKLLVKEDLIPRQADRLIFTLAPIIAVISALGSLAVIPYAGTGWQFTLFDHQVTIQPWITDLNVGLLYIMAISSLGVFGIVLGGWASNSRYPLLGAMRSAAQMVSYEVPFGLAIIGPLMVVGSASMVKIVEWQAEHSWLWWMQPVGLVLFYIAGVAENNRAPFDLPEAEQELVAGFHTEYSGMKFAFFFLAEYIAMIIVSAVVVTVFLGGWLPPTLGLGKIWPIVPQIFSGEAWAPGWLVPFISAFWFVLKVVGVLWTYLWLRATFPRYRYDQLMAVGWKVLIPFSLAWLLLTGVWLLWIG